MTPNLQELSSALQASWGADTAYDAEEWSHNNKARGQCVVTSLIVQDYLGGDLIRYEVTDDHLSETHYMNQLSDGTVIDLTASQYTSTINMKRKPISTGEFGSVRDKRLADRSTALRYEILKRRVEQLLKSYTLE
jgi:hypothetical protein